MYFNELRFFAFFAIVFAVHWTLRGQGARKNWLLLVSYAFYSAWDWRFLGLIVLSTLVDYAAGLALEREGATRRARRLWMLGSLIVNLGVLGLFKYFDFFVTQAADLIGALGFEAHVNTLGWLLPVGISFYTFQTLSYTIDVYRGKLATCHNLRDFALFVAFFPQLVAGPIVRASDFLPQLIEPRRFWTPQYRALAWMFLFGYVKKACVADNLAPFVDTVFGDPAAHGAAELWIGAAAYYTQIYCDFSGYSDMAIATAGMLGYRLPLNFAFPMFATSVTTGWRRWHISLSSWFRDYLYIPLGGNRGSSARTAFNLCAVFFLCGLWHGAAWTFVLWGAVHGAFLIAERALPFTAKLERTPLGIIHTQLVFMLAFVVFRTPNLEVASHYFAGLFGASAGAGATDANGPLWTWGAFLLVFIAGHFLAYRRIGYAWAAGRPNWLRDVALGVAAALAIALTAPDYQPFIYFQF